MSGSVIDLLNQSLGGGAVDQVGRQLGVDSSTAEKAIAGALPMLVAALANNSSQRGGAESLLGALDRDHDGSVLDDVTGFLGQGRGATNMGEGILRHVLGGRQQNAQAGLSKMAGIDRSQAASVLAMLAPLVMGALGRAKRQQRMGPSEIGQMLGRERQRMAQQDDRTMGMIGSLIDRDGDGSIGDDVARIGAGMLGKFFSRR